MVMKKGDIRLFFGTPVISSSGKREGEGDEQSNVKPEAEDESEGAG
jgi:hypothetical protein